MEYPLISCLCVTRNKTEKLRLVINCFLAQRYPNKELLITYESDDKQTAEFISDFKGSYDNDNIYYLEIEVTPKRSLGELRNISIEYCKGEYFCQWDDDDWYHADRLKIQMEAIINNFQDASILTNWILFDETEQQAYFSLFRLWEGSILCSKSVITNELRYPALPKMEDAIFINLLVDKRRVYPVVASNLYIYVYHGLNTWSKEHFQRNFSYAQKLPSSISSLIGDILMEKYPIAEASDILNSEAFQKEIKYFFRNNINMPNKLLFESMRREEVKKCTTLQP